MSEPAKDEAALVEQIASAVTWYSDGSAGDIARAG